MSIFPSISFSYLIIFIRTKFCLISLLLSKFWSERMSKALSLYRNTSGVGFLSLLYAFMDKPLNIWEKQVRAGHIRRLFDEDGVPALQILAQNALNTFIATPAAPYDTLGIQLNYLVLVVKKLDRMFTFEVQILDDHKIRRRFRFCNYQVTVRKNVTCCHVPLLMHEGWNEVSVNLSDFTRKAYATEYVECVRIKVHSNCRLRQVYFTASPISSARVLNIMRTTLSTSFRENSHVSRQESADFIEVSLQSQLIAKNSVASPVPVPSNAEQTNENIREQLDSLTNELVEIRTKQNKVLEQSEAENP